MEKKEIVIEEVMDALVGKVWEALTNKDKLSNWFFEIDDFELRKGFVFTFYEGGEEQKYQHTCKIVDIVFQEKLSFTWEYPDIEGTSIVTLYLQPERGKTRVKLVHEGIDSFPQDKPDFNFKDFEDGWRDIISISLKEYVQNN